MRPVKLPSFENSTSKRRAETDREESTKRVKTEDSVGEHMDAEPIGDDLRSSGTLRLDVPLTTNISDRSPFEALLCHDVGTRIIHFAMPSVSSHDDQTLVKATRLASASKALNLRMRNDPNAASIRWLWNLNHIGDQIRGKLDASSLTVLIHGISDVWLPGQPDAQKARTDILIQRLLWCTHEEQFKSLLSALFEQTMGHALDSHHRMFIDPQYLALSALGAIVHRFGNRPVTTRLIDRIVALSQSLSPRSLAAFWAELALLDRKVPERRADALNNLDRLIAGDPELSALRQFVDEAIRFLEDPRNAPDPLRAAMIDQLRSHNTLWPSSVKLLTKLASLVEPEEEGVMPLSEEQSTRLQCALIRYMQALNALHINIDMAPARTAMSRIPIDLLMSAFSELEMDDKLKFVDILIQFERRDRDDFFFQELQAWLPMIKSALKDKSIPLGRRLLLVNDLLYRMQKTSFIGKPEAVELGELFTTLSVELNAYMEATSSSSTNPPSEEQV